MANGSSIPTYLRAVAELLSEGCGAGAGVLAPDVAGLRVLNLRTSISSVLSSSPRSPSAL